MNRFLLTISIFLIPFNVVALDCSLLITNQAIHDFIRKTQESNPLFRKNVSVNLELDPCEMTSCQPQNRLQREQQKKYIYLLKIDDNKRTFFSKGPQAPQCIVERGKKQSLCSQCSWNSNSQCRSYKVGGDITTLRGTNIDRNDFNILTDTNHHSECFEISTQPGYIKIVTTKIGGGSHYDKIVGFYMKEKNVPVTVNYFSQGILRKVYRFFPKYYVQIQGEWIATAARVRTTQGTENAYVFETLIHIVKDKNKDFSLYLDLKKDPHLVDDDYNFLFRTDQ